MVPATMCRTAMVAALCAVAACFAVLMTTPAARADEPVPLGQSAPASEAPSAEQEGLDSVDASSDWSGEDWSGHDPDPEAVTLCEAFADELLGDRSVADTTWDEWLENACADDWAWEDWYWDPPAEAPPAEDQQAEDPPATEAPSDPAPSDAPAEDTVTADADGADSLLATSTTISPLAAPTMSVSGNTVSWTPISGVSSYVFVRKVPNQTPQYSIVNGTSVTPPTVAGTTVNYGVRTNVSGSTWAREVSITYSGSPTPSPTPQPIDGTFQMGVVAGSAHRYELSFLKALGVRTARLEFGVGTPASYLASDIDAYARAGIRPLLLAGFRGRLPTVAEAQNLGSWAAMYGPGGTFWQGKTYPANTAVTQIEFGNETSYSYQFSDNSLSTYATRAQTYALRARDAANAIRAANPRVGLIAQGDNAVNGTAWVTNVMRAVPTLDDLIAGWTIHPYGPSWATRMDSTINSAAAAGARALPLWVTEWGLSSDNGRCLSDNYGWNKCMTYSSAASTLHSVLSGMHTRYGGRLGAFYLYQAHDQHATGTQTGREAYFGALQSNGTAKGAYTTEVKANLAVN
jgi:hypothetical protein